MPKKQVKKTNSVNQPKVSTSGKGRVYITATLNNTLVTVTNEDGNTLCWSSTGAVGFKGSRKSTPYASTMALEAVFKKAQELGIRQVEVFLKGPGSGRDAALRAFRASPFKVIQIADVTPLPHNGTRKPKVRRG
ncbi:30S ribosomal protein S11 [Candidatus Collierbacteria bacterium]|nr:30S ribosomal protein S11 [Candidatus Collierbacteria bacterium]